MNIRRTLTGLAALALIGGGTLLAAPSASADETWYQAIERASAEATCMPPADETPWQDSFTGQREWTPSWAEWANHGKGGWVCQRWITWAKDTPKDSPAAAGVDVCAEAGGGWLHFGSAYFLPLGTEGYSEGTCTTPLGLTTDFDTVYTGSGAGSDPEALCQSAFGVLSHQGFLVGTDVWTCTNPG